ncbi:MAG: dihydroorotate dehydrogenase, partial [Chloroflexi bacterium]|nr:dihydroorotate dehydrogenase [Chloroflexota bacterium]
MPRLEVDLAPKRPGRLVLKNPVMTASGTFGFGTEYGGLAEVERLGAVTSKGVTLNPRIGNAAPRVCETPAGMLNSVGLPNVGVRRVIEEMAPVWRTWPVPVIVNLAGETVEEYGEAAALLDRVPEVAALELNVSSPNSKGMGMAFGASPEIAAEVTALVRSRTELPVLVKLTPNVGQIVPIARAVADAGADAISLINTLLAMA